jgi:3-methyladenine DNA glycosylase/8-oxoguanine DNA glycosylase
VDRQQSGIIFFVAGPTIADITAKLAERDRVLASLVERHGPPPRRRPAPSSQRFAALAEIIVYQQLAGKAAATIHGRFEQAMGGPVTPDLVLAASPELLTSTGLSRAKAASIRDLAEKVVTGEIVLERIGRLSDDEVIEHLTRVRGIGPWTAQMFLLDTLGRLDVWPTGDYGVRAGFAAAWGLSEIPSSQELMALGQPFSPYRSLVAWYCWRVLDDRATAS